MKVRFMYVSGQSFRSVPVDSVKSAFKWFETLDAKEKEAHNFTASIHIILSGDELIPRIVNEGKNRCVCIEGHSIRINPVDLMYGLSSKYGYVIEWTIYPKVPECRLYRDDIDPYLEGNHKKGG